MIDRFRLIIFILLWASVLSPAEAQWTQWAGPSRDFKSPETGLLERWPAGGPPLLWEVEHPGNYASILADGELLFSMFKDGDHTEVLRALNAADGSTRWELRYRVPEPPESVALNFGRGPNATPAIAGERIVSVGFLGNLWSLEKDDGTVLWSRNLVEDYGAKTHDFGYSISPLVHGDRVLVGVGGERYGVVAFDIDSGEPVWESDPIDVSYTSPILIEVDGEEQMVLMASTEVVGMDPDDGRILWRFPHANSNENNCSAPLWGDDQILVIGSHSEGGASGLSLRRQGTTTTVEEIWHTKEIVFFHTASLRFGSTVYATSGTWSPTDLIAFEVGTGEVLWRVPEHNKANLVYAEGKVYMLTEEGQLSLAELSPQGLKVISSFQALEETAWAPPTLAGGRLYVRDQKRVKAFDVSR